MNKYTKIPSGYRLTLCTAENDTDYGGTSIYEGLSIRELRKAIDLCNLMKGENGNLYSPSLDEKIKLFNELNKIFNLYSYKAITTELLEDDSNVEDYFWSVLNQYGFIGQAEYQFTRYTESFRVEYVPEEISILDVTKEFL